MKEINSRRKNLSLAVAIAALFALCAVIVPATDSDATGENLTGYGTVNEIKIAPGYSWTYTATFPADLEAGTALTFQINELNDTATITGHTLKISTIPSNLAGKSYNIVLKAYHAESDQTSYQWIRIAVNAALSVDYAGCLNEIILGASQNIELKSEGGVGTVSWTASEMAPGLSLNDNKVTGTPTKVGSNRIVLKATSTGGETKDLSINFTVYNVIVGDDSEDIVAIGGKSVSTRAVTQTGSDLGVRWTADAVLPQGLSLNPETGVVSGTYTGSTVGQNEVHLVGTSTSGPQQTTQKTVTIKYEPAFVIEGAQKLLTFKGNEENAGVLLTASADTSALEWSIPATEGISINDGKLVLTGDAQVTDSGQLTVTARSAYGQVVTKTVDYVVEDILSISGPSKLVGKQGISASGTYTIVGGSSNTVAVSENTYGDALRFSDGTLSISYPQPHDAETVTLTVTSAAGQTASVQVEVVVFSTMGFDSVPGASGIYAFAE